MTDNQGRKPISTRQRNAAFIASGGCCSYCGDDILTAFEIDHVHPVSKGGDNRDENLVAVCANCNRSKNAMTLEEWRSFCGGGMFWFEHPNRANAALTDVLVAPHVMALNSKQSALDREIEFARQKTREANETVERVTAAIEVLGMLTHLGPMSPAWVIMLDSLKHKSDSPVARRDLSTGLDTKANWKHFFSHNQLKSWKVVDEFVEDSFSSTGDSNLHQDLEYRETNGWRGIRDMLFQVDHGMRDELEDAKAVERLRGGSDAAHL